MSGLIGAVKTAGRWACSAEPSPLEPCTDTMGLEAAILINMWIASREQNDCQGGVRATRIDDAAEA